jgi:hypothetical protein
MIDLGGFDARATVPSSAQEQARVFAQHRAKVQALAREPLMVDKRAECCYTRVIVKGANDVVRIR